jgi:hypothetical protein
VPAVPGLIPGFVEIFAGFCLTLLALDGLLVTSFLIGPLAFPVLAQFVPTFLSLGFAVNPAPVELFVS